MTSAWGLGHHSPLFPLFDDPPGAGVGGSAPAACGGVSQGLFAFRVICRINSPPLS